MAPWSGGFRFELFNAPSDFATLPGNSVTIRSGADLSGTTFIRGISTTDTLTLDNVALRGGSFDIVDPTRGIALGADQGSFKTINLSNGAVLSLTNNLRTNTGPASAINIDAASTCAPVARPVPRSAVQARTRPGRPRAHQSGHARPGDRGTPGNITTLGGNYVQGASASLLVGVTPTAVDGLAVLGSASIDGRLLLAWAPGTYAAGSRSFLTAGGTLTGTSSSVGDAPGTGANLVLGSPTPTTGA